MCICWCVGCLHSYGIDSNTVYTDNGAISHNIYLPPDIYGALKGLGRNVWSEFMELVRIIGPLVDPLEAQLLIASIDNVY